MSDRARFRLVAVLALIYAIGLTLGVVIVMDPNARAVWQGLL